jgi:hypothetical protein
MSPTGTGDGIAFAGKAPRGVPDKVFFETHFPIPPDRRGASLCDERLFRQEVVPKIASAALVGRTLIHPRFRWRLSSWMARERRTYGFALQTPSRATFPAWGADGDLLAPPYVAGEKPPEI